MRLFIDNVPSFYGVEDLVLLFSPHGSVVSAEIERGDNGESLRFGYVEMACARAARDAVEHLNGSVVDNHLLLVMPADDHLGGSRGRHTRSFGITAGPAPR